MITTASPRSAGYYTFKGVRRTASRKFIVTLDDELVEVRKARSATGWRIEVLEMGKPARYPVDMFEGVFTRVEIKPCTQEMP